jgi:tetratricopeptide (TPR) repeat protein
MSYQRKIYNNNFNVGGTAIFKDEIVIAGGLWMPGRKNLAYVYNARGRAYYKKGQHDAATGDFKRAIQLKPDLAEAIADARRTQDHAATCAGKVATAEQAATPTAATKTRRATASCTRTTRAQQHADRYRSCAAVQARRDSDGTSSATIEPAGPLPAAL